MAAPASAFLTGPGLTNSFPRLFAKDAVPADFKIPVLNVCESSNDCTGNCQEYETCLAKNCAEINSKYQSLKESFSNLTAESAANIRKDGLIPLYDIADERRGCGISNCLNEFFQCHSTACSNVTSLLLSKQISVTGLNPSAPPFNKYSTSWQYLQTALNTNSTDSIPRGVALNVGVCSYSKPVSLDCSYNQTYDTVLQLTTKPLDASTKPRMINSSITFLSRFDDQFLERYLRSNLATNAFTQWQLTPFYSYTYCPLPSSIDSISQKSIASPQNFESCSLPNLNPFSTPQDIFIVSSQCVSGICNSPNDNYDFICTPRSFPSSPRGEPPVISEPDDKPNFPFAPLFWNIAILILLGAYFIRLRKLKKIQNQVDEERRANEVRLREMLDGSRNREDDMQVDTLPRYEECPEDENESPPPAYDEVIVSPSPSSPSLLPAPAPSVAGETDEIDLTESNATQSLTDSQNQDVPPSLESSTPEPSSPEPPSLSNR
ncbi:hypothetical protein BKA69DRAFT_1105439 [Paraphysoderma sedebokerense]|nr:hypothetical protein BKA69DRAFT_1105439 [Paraphysoderma sedebokerense]